MTRPPHHCLRHLAASPLDFWISRDWMQTNSFGMFSLKRYFSGVVSLNSYFICKPFEQLLTLILALTCIHLLHTIPHKQAAIGNCVHD